MTFDPLKVLDSISDMVDTCRTLHQKEEIRRTNDEPNYLVKLKAISAFEDF